MDYVLKANQAIPSPSGKTITRYQDGDTRDIIETILYADKQLGNDMCVFASAFSRSYDSLYDLWHFTRTQIKYVADSPGHERVKDPKVTWADRTGDCKSFSLFVASVLRCLKISYRYRFASYSGNDPTHVYVIAKINKRDVILDATIDRFDSEVPYLKKWDKMAQIDYLHGGSNVAPAVHTRPAKPTSAQRIADAPRVAMPKKFIDYSGLTEGQLTLTLLEELTKLNASYYGDPNGTFQKALNIIYQTSKDPHRISGHIGYIDESLYGLMPYIEYAMERSKPAGFGTAHLGDFATDRANILAECRHAKSEYSRTRTNDCGFPAFKKCLDDNEAARKYIPKKRDGTAWDKTDLLKFVNNCQDQIFFVDLFNNNLEGSSPHLLYEHIPNGELNSLPGTANFKANNHRLANSSMARYSKLDRTNIVLWERLGISRTAAAKGLKDISPEGLIDYMKLANTPNIGAIDPATIVLLFVVILPIFLAALGFAGTLLTLIMTKRAAFASEVRGYGTEEFGPGKDDFEGSTTFDFNSLLIPGALALGGIVLLNQK